MCVCGCRKVPKKPFRAVELERAQASGVRVTVMNHTEHILNLPRVRGTCVELLSLPFLLEREREGWRDEEGESDLLMKKKKKNYKYDCVLCT